MERVRKEMEQQRLWVVAESQGEELKESTYELLTEVARLAAQRGNKVMVLLDTAGDIALEKMAEELGVYGAEAILPLASAGQNSSRQVGEAIAALAKELHPDAVFIAETIWGHEVASWTAAGLGTALLADCVELGLGVNQELTMSRHVYGDTVAIKFAAAGEQTLVVTVQSGLFNVKKSFPGQKARLLERHPARAGVCESVKVLEFIKADPKTVDIIDAERLVVGGKGMGTAENYALIRETAEVLSAAVGGTRVARDNGWVSLVRQIGQTGKTVAPELLISCGVSGAIQHTMGLKETKCLVAINTDKHAPIHKLADLSIVEDAPKVLAEFIAKMKTTAERRQSV